MRGPIAVRAPTKIQSELETFDFFDLKQFLYRAAIDGTELLDAFESPPDFDVWGNPVLEQAQTFETLALTGRSRIAQEIFRNCNASALCDDGHELVDGGINKNHRLWLVYRFDSLTDFSGQDHYTCISGVITVKRRDSFVSELFLGFDWQRDEALGHLLFDEREGKLKSTVLQKPAWRARHRWIHHESAG